MAIIEILIFSRSFKSSLIKAFKFKITRDYSLFFVHQDVNWQFFSHNGLIEKNIAIVSSVGGLRDRKCEKTATSLHWLCRCSLSWLIITTDLASSLKMSSQFSSFRLAVWFFLRTANVFYLFSKFHLKFFHINCLEFLSRNLTRRLFLFLIEKLVELWSKFFPFSEFSGSQNAQVAKNWEISFFWSHYCLTLSLHGHRNWKSATGITNYETKISAMVPRFGSLILQLYQNNFYMDFYVFSFWCFSKTTAWILPSRAQLEPL